MAADDGQFSCVQLCPGRIALVHLRRARSSGRSAAQMRPALPASQLHNMPDMEVDVTLAYHTELT
jgi:hypothetical protein